MFESRSAITVALMVISLTSGTTQAFKCFLCVDSPTAPNPACRVNSFNPISLNVGTQNPSTPVNVTLPTIIGSITLTSSDFDCSTACAVYTSALQSLTVRSCNITANIRVAFPDVQAQYCHTDYCNSSPMFPDTPPPDAPSSLQCYACYNSAQLGSSVLVGCDDSNFLPVLIPIQEYGDYFEIGPIVIPPVYFNCSACQVVKIPSIGLTVRGCSTTYDLASLFPDVQTQTCYSNRCNGYHPLITDSTTESPQQSGAVPSFQRDLYIMRIGLIVAAVLQYHPILNVA